MVDGSASAGSDRGDGAVPLACPPASSVTPSSATWVPPHAAHTNQCTAQEAAAIASCLVENRDCAVAVRSTCHACAVSGPTSALASPLVVPAAGAPPELNVAGCVASLAGDTSAAGCGPKLVAHHDCLLKACVSCADAGDRARCREAADTTTCRAAKDAAACATPYLSQCVTGTTVLEAAYQLVTVACGP